MLCKIGIHDKEIAGNGLSCIDYIKRRLYIQKPIEIGNTMATRRFFIDSDAKSIYRGMYSHIRSSVWHQNRVVQDYVCLRCGECFENISFEKLMIKEYVLNYLEERKNKKIRSQMASDLYRENCEQQGF